MNRIKIRRLLTVILLAFSLPIGACHWADGHHHHGYHDYR